MVSAVRILTAIMGVYFLFAVVMQYNDPDPVQWMAMYGAAALACALALVGRARWWFLVGVAAVAAAWAAMLAPGVIGHVAPRDLFAPAGMLAPAVEEAREMLGLIIVAVWMMVLAVTASAGFTQKRRSV